MVTASLIWMKKFIFDSNIYDHILDNKISRTALKLLGELYITNVQLSELKNIPNQARRDQLLAVVKELQPIKLNLDSGIWLDNLRWDDAQPWRDDIGETAAALYGNSTKTTNWHDALIGEVAKNYSLILVTNDIRFKEKANALQISVITFNEFYDS